MIGEANNQGRLLHERMIDRQRRLARSASRLDLDAMDAHLNRSQASQLTATSRFAS